MFIRWENIPRSWDRKIIDTDFEETIRYGVEGAWPPLVSLYERRNLSVVPNLIKAILWWQEQNPELSVDNILKHIVDFHFWPKYEGEINKYLILL